jgi:hypothetical protein
MTANPAVTATTNSGGGVHAAAYSAKRVTKDGPGPSDLSAPSPVKPPYPAPGWGDGPPPKGHVWEWHLADASWKFGGDGEHCRLTSGMPGGRACGRPAVASLLRPYQGTAGRRWFYCADHLYGRHVHDGAVWESRAVPGGAS